MPLHPPRRRLAAALVLVVAVSATAGTATAAPPPATAPAKVDNPQFSLWAYCKPGTSVTLAGDVDNGPQGKVHLEVTQTLASVNADGAVVSEATRYLTQGKTVNGPAHPQPVPARADAGTVRPAGTADVQAMGRTFACRVYDLAPPAPGGARATAYFSPDVPGGTVKLVLTGANGRSITFLITALDVK